MSTSSDQSIASRAIRLTFAYEGDNVHIISQQPVEMIIAPSAPVTDFTSENGFWAELKDASNQTLYRNVMHNPLRGDVEVFSDDPAKSAARLLVPDRKGVFVVLVPDTELGHEVTLSASPGVQAGPRPLAFLGQSAKEIVRVKLNK